MPSTDRIPAVDASDDTERRIREARAQTAVVLSPNTVLNGAEAEDEVFVLGNSGVTTHVIGWRRARREEMQRGYRGMWSGDVGELEGLGLPWWWSRRQIGNVGSQAAAQVDMAEYDRRHRAAQADADASRAARGTA